MGAGRVAVVVVLPTQLQPRRSLMQLSVLRRRLAMHICGCLLVGVTLVAASTLNRHQCLGFAANHNTTTLVHHLFSAILSHDSHVVRATVLFGLGRLDLEPDSRCTSTSDADWKRHVAITLRLLQLSASFLQA